MRSSIPSVCSLPLLLKCGAQPLAERSARSLKNRHAKEQTCQQIVASVWTAYFFRWADRSWHLSSVGNRQTEKRVRAAKGKTMWGIPPSKYVHFDGLGIPRISWTSHCEAPGWPLFVDPFREEPQSWPKNKHANRPILYNIKAMGRGCNDPDDIGSLWPASSLCDISSTNSP